MVIRPTVGLDCFNTLIADAEKIGTAVAGEISIKLDAMWKEFPLTLLGIYGEQHGYSTAVVNLHIKRTFEKFDALGSRPVDNVTLSYLGAESIVADSLRSKVSLNLPLRHFRETLMFVRGHATALLCSRRNEGDHRNLKLESRHTYNISAVLLMSRLRSGQTADDMDAASFVTFAGKAWHRRGNGAIANLLLEHIYPAFRLHDMSWHTKTMRVYGSVLSDLFADQSEAKAAVSTFKALTLPCRRTLLTPLESQVAQMCMSMMVPGSIVSFPRAFLSPVSVGGNVKIIAIIDAVEASPPFVSIDNVLSTCIFVEVGKTRDRIRVASSCSTSLSEHSARCQQVVVHSNDGESVTLSRSADTVDVDFQTVILSSLWPQLFSHIIQWYCIGNSTTVRPKRHHLADAVSENISNMSLAALTDDDRNLECVADQAIMEYVCDRMDTHADQNAALDALICASALPAVAVDSLPTFQSICHIDTAVALSDRGLVDVSRDEFGESRLVLKPAAISVHSVFLVKQAGYLPFRSLELSKINYSLSKFELIALSVGAGFRCLGAPVFYKKDGPRIYGSDDIGASKWFWLVLAIIDRVFDRGVRCIYTGMPAKYYEYLYRLRNPLQLNEYGDIVSNWKHSKWVGLLAGEDPLTCDNVVEEPLPLMLTHEDEEPVPLALPADAPPPPELRLDASATTRPPVLFSGLELYGQTVKVHFDGGTHASGDRCFASCPRHKSEKCRKYEFIHHFPSTEDCVLSLAAWQLGSVHCSIQETHQPYKGSESELELARQFLPAGL